MRKSLTVALTISCWLASIALFSSHALADGAYRWEDGDGQVFYGSTPPKAAKNVTRLSGKGLSRYSSDKLLKPYRGRLAEKAALIQESELTPPIQVPPGFLENDDNSPLVAQPIQIEFNTQNEVTRCEVSVTNEAAIPVNGVTVSFEFDDGLVIPAVGPLSLAPSAEAKYAVPSTALPFSVKPVGGDLGATATPPRVVIETAADPDAATPTPQGTEDEIGPQATGPTPKK